MSTTHQQAGCSSVLEAANSDTLQKEHCISSKMELAEPCMNTNVQPCGRSSLPENVQTPPNKTVHLCDESARTSDRCSAVIGQETINMADCDKTSPGQPLEGACRRHGNEDTTHLCGCMLSTESDVLAHACTDVHEKQDQSSVMQDNTGGIDAPYLCGECGKRFGSSTALTRHERLHLSDGDYKCSYCAKTFHQSWNLNAHKRTHTGEKPFMCLACGKTFRTSSNLVVHNRTHTGEKPYVCAVCGASFSRIMHLTRHKRVHTGQRPYLCEVCGKAFQQKWTLNQHEKTHSKEKAYVCSECGQGFKQRSGYKQHMKRYHAPVVLNEPCLLDTVI